MTEAILEAGSWIYKMLFTLVIVMTSVAIVGLAIRYSLNTIDVQRDVMLDRILYDPHGIWYTDTNGMMLPGVLDKSLFTQTHMDSAFVYPTDYGGAQLTLLDGTTRTNVFIQTKNYNDLLFTMQAGLQNGGWLTVRTYPVVIQDGNQRRNGMLIVQIAMPSRA